VYRKWVKLKRFYIYIKNGYNEGAVKPPFIFHMRVYEY